MTREIELTQGKIAIVDDADYEYLRQFNWFAAKNGNTFYAARNDNGHTILMHRLILNAPEGIEIDHRDRNGLNNTRLNLRLANRSQNMANGSKRKDNTSGYRGVYWYDRIGTWIAQIKVNGQLLYLGSFKSPEDAAKTYDTAAREHFGEFAQTNFQEGK